MGGLRNLGRIQEFERISWVAIIFPGRCERGGAPVRAFVQNILRLRMKAGFLNEAGSLFVVKTKRNEPTSPRVNKIYSIKLQIQARGRPKLSR